MYRKDGERDMRFKENKDWASGLTMLAYILIIGVVLYLGWQGIFKLFSNRKNDDRPLIVAGIHSLILIIIFVCGFVTDGDTQKWFIGAFVYSIMHSIIFTLIGFVLNMVIKDK
jgi:DMSO/TMAO reductase YedYZ heme-binding membrane subunit